MLVTINASICCHTANDRIVGGKVMVQTFAGTATLILQGNTWLIDEKSSKKTGSRTE